MWTLWRAAGLTAAAALLVAGCTKEPTKIVTTEDVTQTRTVVSTRPTDWTPPPAKDLPYLAPGDKPAKGDKEKSCPYIRTGLQLDPTNGPNVAAIEGSRIYRNTVVTTAKPVGCRFYFWSGPFYATTEILPRTFPSALEAHNAMIQIAEKQGTQLEGKKGIAPGVDAVLFRTKFYDQDKGRDWACAFAKGDIMVVIRTARTDSSTEALLLAQAVASRF